jgi:hypothetical protein
MQLSVDGEIRGVGVARANILNSPADSEFAIGLVEARLREELKPAIVRKTARSDVENDLLLLEQLLTRQAKATSAANSAREASYGAERLPSNESANRSDPIP